MIVAEIILLVLNLVFLIGVQFGINPYLGAILIIVVNVMSILYFTARIRIWWRERKERQNWEIEYDAG